MGLMRRTFNLICALTLTIGAGYALVYLLVYPNGFNAWMLLSATAALFAGLYWLWEDFISAYPRPEN